MTGEISTNKVENVEQQGVVSVRADMNLLSLTNNGKELGALKQPAIDSNNAGLHKLELHDGSLDEFANKIMDTLTADQMAKDIEQGKSLNGDDTYIEQLTKEGKTKEAEELIQMTNDKLKQDGSDLSINLDETSVRMGTSHSTAFDLTVRKGSAVIQEDNWERYNGDTGVQYPHRRPPHSNA